MYRPCRSAMSYNVMESMVRQRLREKKGQVYWAAMDALASRQNFSTGSCPCGRTGLTLRW